jgi:hypothetical protein
VIKLFPAPSSQFWHNCRNIYYVNKRTLREEHRMRVSENRVLRGIFGPKRDEVMGD